MKDGSEGSVFLVGLGNLQSSMMAPNYDKKVADYDKKVPESKKKVPTTPTIVEMDLAKDMIRI